MDPRGRVSITKERRSPNPNPGSIVIPKLLLHHTLTPLHTLVDTALDILLTTPWFYGPSFDDRLRSRPLGQDWRAITSFQGPRSNPSSPQGTSNDSPRRLYSPRTFIIRSPFPSSSFSCRLPLRQRDHPFEELQPADQSTSQQATQNPKTKSTPGAFGLNQSNSDQYQKTDVPYKRSSSLNGYLICEDPTREDLPVHPSRNSLSNRSRPDTVPDLPTLATRQTPSNHTPTPA